MTSHSCWGMLRGFFLLFLGVQVEMAAAFVPHTGQGSVACFVLFCRGFEEGLQPLLISETASLSL